MAEPIRHLENKRNRRKLIKLSRDLLEELNHLYDEHLKARNNLEYAVGRCRRIINRLEAEVEAEVG
jgi:hypothetical protein